jgi:hypothetical protein
VLKGNSFYLICVLFSDSVNIAINVSLKNRMIVNNELIRKWKETLISSVDGCACVASSRVS